MKGEARENQSTGALGHHQLVADPGPLKMRALTARRSFIFHIHSSHRRTIEMGFRILQQAGSNDGDVGVKGSRKSSFGQSRKCFGGTDGNSWIKIGAECQSVQNFVSYDALQHFNLGILEFNVGAVHGDHADYWPLVYRRQNAGRGIGDDCRGDVLDQDEKHQVGDSLLLSVD